MINMNEATTTLVEMLGAKPTVYGKVITCARSGLSRKIGFYCVVDGKIENISHKISVVLGLKYGRQIGSVMVRGCGMDMIYATIYSLSISLYNEGYKIRKECL